MPDSQAAGGNISTPIELRAVGISKSFGERTVLRGISLQAHRGDLVCIVGGSGSGKTVLMHILAGLIEPDTGTVEAADHSTPGAPLVRLFELDRDQLERVRLSWAVVFQRNALFSGSVRENIALLLREHAAMSTDDTRELTESQITDLARRSLIDAALDPDEVLDKDRDTLSGGMAKRVAIARAIAIDPALIFYDEPTTGLDPVISGRIHELVFNTHHQPRSGGARRTSIIVTHDKDLLRRLEPRVVMLYEGRAIFDGPYRSFVSIREGPAGEYLRAMPVLQSRVI
ncbi:MAG: ATP-binding cassette domain-containing protein [Phycisphaeraceae bacterium]|nr:ATP-binding cassette domain-containing protein [Phycisphaerae bacterium]MBX3392156.1 ATP-binding cassette domain-containing protein [Phycisphaeraceae bacterium]HRJ49498.1 ATP-binding cassette domain-containing protein [Phycisphaerales bacterium]